MTIMLSNYYLGSLGADFMIWLRKSQPFCLGRCWLSTSTVAKSHSPIQNITTTHNTQHTQQPTWAAATLLQEALPSLSMATSAIDQNHGAMAPNESYAGFRCGGLVHAPLFSLYGMPKWHPSKEREGWDLDLRYPPLDGGIEQPTQGSHRQRIRGEGNGALGNNKGVGPFPIIWGVQQVMEKLK